jgi:DNA-binding protein H-NS
MSLAEELLADLEEQEEEQEDDELKAMIEETNAQQETIDQEMRDLSQDIKPDNLLKLSAYKFC